MKKIVLCLILISAVIIPIACGNSNNSPATPIGGAGSTFTPTKTLTPVGGVATNTPTPGGPTNTPTSTPTTSPTAAIGQPPYTGNQGLSSAPNGAYYRGTGAAGSLFVAENDGVLPMVEIFTNASGSLSLSNAENYVVLSGGATVLLVGPQGFTETTYTGGGGPVTDFAILDVASSGAATIYSGSIASLPGAPLTVASWGNQGLKFPKGFTADTFGNFYCADTGTGFVEQWQAQGSPGSFPFHRWNAYFNNTSGAAATFVTPYAVACDPNPTGYVYVGDSGITNSLIVQFKSGGTTVLSYFNGVPGCVVHGLAVDASENVYVSDSANNQLEEYTQVAGVWSLQRFWKLPASSSEYYTFNPSCIALTGSNIFVGDATNELIDIFGP